MVDKRLAEILDRIPKSVHCRDAAPLGLKRQHQTGANGVPVERDGARTADAFGAAVGSSSAVLTSTHNIQRCQEQSL